MTIAPRDDEIHRATIEVDGAVDKRAWRQFKQEIYDLLAKWRAKGGKQRVRGRVARVEYIKKGRGHFHPRRGEDDDR